MTLTAIQSLFENVLQQNDASCAPTPCSSPLLADKKTITNQNVFHNFDWLDIKTSTTSKTLFFGNHFFFGAAFTFGLSFLFLADLALQKFPFVHT